MRAVVQRVLSSSVSVEGELKAKIGQGLNILLGIATDDDEKDIKYLAEKIANLRIFDDDNDVMNLSLLDIKGEALVISQFTLMGDVRKGRRPSYQAAAKPDVALALYQEFVAKLESLEVKVATGVFQADMQVEILNDGPVTILLDSKKLF